MHVRALEQKTSDNPVEDDMLQEMMNICALNPTVESLKRLGGCKCLPVRQRTSGAVVWTNCSAEFVILDRREYGEIFQNTINLMDFSLEQVHALGPFLEALGLQNRYISQQIKEETKVQVRFFNHSLTEDLRKKTYAICR
jgi:hypothetical protein